MNVLVTGGAGYIGSHVCKALSEKGFHPVSYDNLKNGKESAVKWGPLVKGDLLDNSLIVDTIKRFDIEAVMHFAALAYVGESVAHPDRYYTNNVVGSLSLLEAMKKTGIKPIVFSSTCAVYGHPQSDPITEDHPQKPVNPYGNTKAVVERMLADFKVPFGIDSISLRYFNAAGCDFEAGIGEDHSPETHLIPLAVKAALGTAPPLVIFGTDYDTPDRTCIRDYIHVNDLASAHLAALDSLREGKPHSLAYNLGSGSGFSVKEVVACVEKVIGKKVPHTLGKRRPGDPARLRATCAAAQRELGWTARLTMLEAMVESVGRWERLR